MAVSSFVSIAMKLLSVVTLARSMPAYLSTGDSSFLRVELSRAGPTEVKATVTNIGLDTLRLFTSGTVLDSAPVLKVDVRQDGLSAPFTGICAFYATKNLPEVAFVTLTSGSTVESTFNVASVFDLTGGEYSIQSTGAMGYAEVGSTDLSGEYRYNSNVLDMEISIEDIKRVPKATTVFEERSSLESCNASQRIAVRTAFFNVHRLAADAENAARNGSTSEFLEFFHTADSDRRSLVADRFHAISQEAASISDNHTMYSCVGDSGYCAFSGAVAYHPDDSNTIYNCAGFYELPATPQFCGDISQATAVLHEMTHVASIFTPGTDDFLYRWAGNFSSLTAEQALENADSYAVYADSVALGCESSYDKM